MSDNHDPMATEGIPCPLCARYGIFRWLSTCGEIGHVDRAGR